MPKININGITREMTAEEIAEMKALAAQMPPQEETTAEQRLEELETAIIELAAIIGGM